MRSLSLAVALAALFALSCAHGAYGPSSDQRLEEATTAKPSTDGAEVASTRCADLAARARDVKSEEKPEAERLSTMTELFTAAKERQSRLDDAVARNPDLVYSPNGEAIKVNRDECQAFFADARSDLDRFLREVTDMLIIQEIQGSRTVGVARLDFALVRNALEVLAPDDKDMLLAKVDSAERKVGIAKPSAKDARSTGKRK